MFQLLVAMQVLQFCPFFHRSELGEIISPLFNALVFPPLLHIIWTYLFSQHKIDVYLRKNLKSLSQVRPPCSFTAAEINNLTDRIQNGGTEVVEVIFSVYSWNKYKDSIFENIGKFDTQQF